MRALDRRAFVLAFFTGPVLTSITSIRRATATWMAARPIQGLYMVSNMSAISFANVVDPLDMRRFGPQQRVGNFDDRQLRHRRELVAAL